MVMMPVVQTFAHDEHIGNASEQDVKTRSQGLGVPWWFSIGVNMNRSR